MPKMAAVCSKVADAKAGRNRLGGAQLFDIDGVGNDLPCFHHQPFVDSSWSGHVTCAIISLILKAQ